MTVAARASAPAVSVVTLVDGLTNPSDLDFTPDGTMLFTQKDGKDDGLSVRRTDGEVHRVDGLDSDGDGTLDKLFPDTVSDGQAGLLAIVVDPDFDILDSGGDRRFYTCQTDKLRRNNILLTVQVIAWSISDDYTRPNRSAAPCSR